MGSTRLILATSLFLFYILVFPYPSDCRLQDDNCKPSSCNVSDSFSASVRFPFRLNGHQPRHCGYDGFDLSCDEKGNTVLELPFSGKFFVKRINYISQVIDLYDPDDCLFRRLPFLNLTSSPFQDEHEINNYTSFNCSYDGSRRYTTAIFCLDTPGYRVFLDINSEYTSWYSWISCTKLKTITSPYLLHGDYTKPYQEYEEDANEVSFRWSQPNCNICEARGKKCQLNDTSRSRHEIVCLNYPGKPSKLAITGVVLGSFLLAVAMVIVIRILIQKLNVDKIEKEYQVKIEKFLEEYESRKPSRYTYADITRMTSQFKEKLGEGGYGSVFKGKLSNEILVAVKVLNSSKGNGEEFINEVGTIGRIHHINVVRLVGFCADTYRRALVYEFLPNESLEKFIFSRDSKKPSLSWEKLQNIALGTAKGIEYLHQGCDQRILHFDIKPHNILLDDNLNPKVSDFGLAKLCSKDKSIVSMTAARGTMGYIAPEVYSRNFGNVSYKSDVYSFGMLLLEMVGGRKNIDATVENTSQVYFPEWIYNRVSQGDELGIKVDDDEDGKIAKKLTIVALWCIQWYPMDRPTMKAVIQMLEGETENLKVPPNPFASSNQSNIGASNPNRPRRIELTVISEI